MPVKYVAEMFCDRIAACRAEHGHGFIHPETSELLTRWLLLLKVQGEDAAFLQIRQELKELRRA